MIVLGLLILVKSEVVFVEDRSNFLIRCYFMSVLIISLIGIRINSSKDQRIVDTIKKRLILGCHKFIRSVYNFKKNKMKSNVETSVGHEQQLWLELPAQKFVADDQKSYEFVNVKPEKHIITGDGVVVRYGKFYFVPSRVPLHKQNKPLNFKINFVEIPFYVQVESEEMKKKRKNQEIFAFMAFILVSVVAGKFVILNI